MTVTMHALTCHVVAKNSQENNKYAAAIVQ